MKSTGITRKVDELGRVVIPRELRRTLDIEEKDPLEIFVDGDRIILRKYNPGCVVCGSADGLVSLDAVRLCPDCVKKAAHKVGLQ
ncbi:AbrB/MazE/SpoVT family DNA-binding domain-containing protein [Sporomusa sphaeroides]|uniref:Transition state regulatory protein AbrB n=1 Tax=Sporomusa sphaeroides DSM 2875 TaxID=1337886 RepID=A0ABM9W053_9FIRM|nr:AbrB/MazE/SpoVT family DNA-binding domain-containing protein [Sporomusa sphaeroides]OLS56409.1 transition state regulatory protein AbrB [Sporomusa sphaeroides DSM 2875]CVK18504.1 Transition state regulatory protein AbrB [Sporomusa sphaeroides DSM 2875]